METRTASNGGLAPHTVLRRFYAQPDERQAFVTRLFDDSARDYDRVVSLMSLGTGARYRKDALRRHGVREGSRVLDVACGTGQVTLAAMRLAGPGGHVVGVDPSAGMRAVAAARGVRVTEGDAEHLPAADGAFDIVVMGYAMRHVSDLVAAFAEMRRVLRPGGRVLVLEITRPEGRLFRMLLRAYLRHIVPPAALICTGNRRAMELMRYYWDSVDQCVRPESILDAMTRAGLIGAKHQRSLGVLSEYAAEQPGSGPVG